MRWRSPGVCLRRRSFFVQSKLNSTERSKKYVLIGINTKPTNDPDVLQSDVQWLKDHPDVRFYIEGYASTRGDDILYNLLLSVKRAEAIKKTIIGMGIPEDRIVLTTGWGQLYPVCPEKDDECWERNRRVIFSYAPPLGALERSRPSGNPLDYDLETVNFCHSSVLKASTGLNAL